MADVDGNRLSDGTDTEQADHFEDAILDVYRQGKRDMRDVAVRLNRRTVRFLIVWFAIAAALALLGVILHIIALTHTDGAAQPQTVTYTLTTTASVHPAADGTCTSGPTDDHVTVSLWDDAGVQRLAPLSPGHRHGAACVFTATMPMLQDARWIAIDGAYHAVPTGVGQVSLSATDGQWRPVKSLAGVL